jgi:hypothetical protein
MRSNGPKPQVIIQAKKIRTHLVWTSRMTRAALPARLMVGKMQSWVRISWWPHFQESWPLQKEKSFGWLLVSQSYQSKNFSPANQCWKPGDWTIQSRGRKSRLPDLQILHEHPVDSDYIPRIMLSVRPCVVRYEFQIVDRHLSTGWREFLVVRDICSLPRMVVLPSSILADLRLNFVMKG